jgi:hypothetical protein
LINGISGMAGAVLQKARDLAASVGDAIKSALHIKSPSRLTLGFGEMTGEGLALGLLGMRDAVGRAAKALATSAIAPIVPQATGTGSVAALALPSAGMVVPAVAGAGPVVNVGGVTVQVPNAGLNEDQVARFAATRIQRIVSLNIGGQRISPVLPTSSGSADMRRQARTAMQLVLVGFNACRAQNLSDPLPRQAGHRHDLVLADALLRRCHHGFG